MPQDFVFDYKKLRVRIFEVIGTARELAKKLGWSEVTMSMKLNQKRDFSREDIMRICEILEIDKTQIGDYFFTLKGEE